MGPITVRAARPGDFAAVATLLAELGRPAVLGGPDEDRYRGRYVAWLADPDRYLFVAEDGDVVIGLVDMAIVPRLNFLAPQAWIPDLVVTRGARGRGAGAALLVRAEEAARERGAWAVRLESANWRARAHAFYLREGYSDDAKSFDKALAELGWAPPTGPEG